MRRIQIKVTGSEGSFELDLCGSIDIELKPKSDYTSARVVLIGRIEKSGKEITFDYCQSVGDCVDSLTVGY